MTIVPASRALVGAWGVPAANLLIAPKGRFSLSLDAGGLERPLGRLVELLRRQPPSG